MVAEPLVALPAAGTPAPNRFSPAAEKIRHASHKTIATVTENLEGLRFNVAVALIRTFSNILKDADGKSEGEAWALREAYENSGAADRAHDAAPGGGDVASAGP